MLKMCSKCGKRPAIVFISEMNGSNTEPRGLCLVCAKEAGIKPIDDMLSNMNLSEEDLEGMSEQLMDVMGMSEDMDGFEMGGAQPFPFLSNLFGTMPSGDASKNDESKSEEKSKTKDGKKKESKKSRFLGQYCTNLTERAKKGELDNIVGRDAEMYRTIQILSRRSKNNPCLIGEPGVGKTAIAEGLAIRIAAGDAPARLLDKEIHLLDMTALVAGTQFRGQFESRVKGLIDEIKAAGNVILFIDEVHNLVGAGDSEGSMNAGNILKPALSRGQLQVIGATTLKEYRKYIEKDSALERRFQPVIIEEPSIDESVNVLLGVKGYYEGYHGVEIPDDIIRKAVHLSERYINDRFLPDKAIDLMDEACACASLRNKAVDKLYIVNKKIGELASEEAELLENVEAPDYEKLAGIKSELAKYRGEAEALYAPAADNKVTDDDLAKVIELWTGIPASKIKETDLMKLSSLEDELKKHIIGQNEALENVVRAVKRSRVSITTHRRPASFIFVGPTGVGKTELVKVLSQQLFHTPETLIRLDMSEFMEKHSVSRLIGAPPGYVGYDDAGQLTEKVRRKPYSVILFDEIEKAHPDVLNILLQILDDGRVTDAQGRVVNFENTIIVMTSNAGSESASNPLGFGKTVQSAVREKAIAALEQFLRPEFIGRVDEIIVFNPLTKDDFAKIAAIALNELAEVLKEKGIELRFDETVCDYIAKKSHGGKRGARDLRNYVRKEVEDKIVEYIIDKADLKSIEIEVKSEEIKFLIK